MLPHVPSSNNEDLNSKKGKSDPNPPDSKNPVKLDPLFNPNHDLASDRDYDFLEDDGTND